MKINRIELCNFGSYAGICVFDLMHGGKGNIVLIGGKNGSGKTTLFSGIKLCLYGNKAGGFESINSFYRKEVRKYINNASKFDISSKCYVKMNIVFSNGQEEDEYEINRCWDNNARTLDGFEEVKVFKNGGKLSAEELDDFENYITNIIPPAMFDLFFFDGEQIADYFLDENSNERVKNAFMILCGYDTFDIMQKNFKRLSFGKKSAGNGGINYVAAKEAVAKTKEEYVAYQEKVEETRRLLDAVNSEIKALEKKYALAGGVTYDVWNEKVLKLKEEEHFREEKNSLLKRLANESIPFIIVKDLLEKVSLQLSKERDKQQHELLRASLKSILPNVMKRVYQQLEWQDDRELTCFVVEELDNEMQDKDLASVQNIINVSGEEYSVLQSSILKCLEADKKLVIKTEREIKKSIRKSQKLRFELENCNIEGAKEFLDNKNMLISKAAKLSEDLQSHIEKLQLSKDVYDVSLAELKREEKKFEEITKNLSITMLSEKSVAFLEKLQYRLYENEISKVEKLFMKKIKELVRKNSFIDSIVIDEEFNIHIYKNVTFNTSDVWAKIKSMGVSEYISEYGMLHCDALKNQAGVRDLNQLGEFYKGKKAKVTAVQEIDKSRLSKGEKQVFIMALYWAIMCLNKQQVPFLIDTPFARIDSEHRANITKKFFMDLSGQVFIFSTNEEIVDKHYFQMKNRIQAQFLLENTDNMQTVVYDNCYFVT